MILPAIKRHPAIVGHKGCLPIHMLARCEQGKTRQIPDDMMQRP
jgi:hypothetical protein